HPAEVPDLVRAQLGLRAGGGHRPAAGGAMRRPVAILAGVALVAGALGLSMLVPSEEQLQSPYTTRVPGFGERLELRTFSLTVTDARLADRVQTDEWTGTTR